jgi:hypothetical protein
MNKEGVHTRRRRKTDYFKKHRNSRMEKARRWEGGEILHK